MAIIMHGAGSSSRGSGVSSRSRGGGGWVGCSTSGMLGHSSDTCASACCTQSLAPGRRKAGFLCPTSCLKSKNAMATAREAFSLLRTGTRFDRRKFASDIDSFEVRALGSACVHAARLCVGVWVIVGHVSFWIGAL